MRCRFWSKEAISVASTTGNRGPVKGGEMRRIGVRVVMVLFGAMLAGCASTQPPPARLSGYTFGYRVSGKVHAQVFSDPTHTFVTVPDGVRIRKADGDGAARKAVHTAPYWVLQGLAAHWVLATSKGTVKVRAPKTVVAQARFLESFEVVKKTRPKPQPRTWSWKIPFRRASAKLNDQTIHTLSDIATKIGGAARVDQVSVTGATTSAGSVWANAEVGAERARVVTDALSLDGVQKIQDTGWNKTLSGEYAIVTAKVKVWEKPVEYVPYGEKTPVRLAGAGNPKAHGGRKPKGSTAGKTAPAYVASAAPVRKTGVPKPPVEVRLDVRGGQLLSQVLERFLSDHGWVTRWESPVDYSIRYRATFRGRTVRAVLQKVATAWPVRVQLYTGNRVAVVTGGVQ